MAESSSIFVGGGSFFMGANSEKGFVPYTDSLYDADTLYIIKGGPGTGKSTLMKNAKKEAEKIGCLCESYYCSSDSGSLDGLKIKNPKNGKTASFCDGTAPHEKDLSLPAAKDDILFLGAFWDRKGLKNEADRLKILKEKKKEGYSLAYHILSAIGKLEDAKNEIIYKYCDLDAARELASALLFGMYGEKYQKSLRPITAITMKGFASLSSFAFAKDTKYTKISDYVGTSSLLLKAIANEAKRHALPTVVCPSPIRPDIADAVYLPTEKRCFILSALLTQQEKRAKSTKSLIKAIPKAETEYLREIDKKKKELLSLAYSFLSIAREAHFETEEIYGRYIDFDKKEQYEKEELKKIFDELK